jgi:hypothetical protein
MAFGALRSVRASCDLAVLEIGRRFEWNVVDIEFVLVAKHAANSFCEPLL